VSPQSTVPLAGPLERPKLGRCCLSRRTAHSIPAEIGRRVFCASSLAEPGSPALVRKWWDGLRAAGKELKLGAARLKEVRDTALALVAEAEAAGFVVADDGSVEPADSIACSDTTVAEDYQRRIQRSFADCGAADAMTAKRLRVVFGAGDPTGPVTIPPLIMDLARNGVDLRDSFDQIAAALPGSEVSELMREFAADYALAAAAIDFGTF
jgi:hypothetical protein